MKILRVPSLLACLAAAGILVTGCGRSSTKMETAEFRQAFAAADATTKRTADEAANALEAGKYLEGSTALANLAKASEEMSDAQKNAMIDLGVTIQLVMSEDGDKADLKVYQAVEDMMAALDGRESARVGVNPDVVRPQVPAAE